jgi:hypothetical protein
MSAFPSSIVVSSSIRSSSSGSKSTASTSASTILSCFSAKSLKFGAGDGYTERMQDIHVYRVTKQINAGGKDIHVYRVIKQINAGGLSEQGGCLGILWLEIYLSVHQGTISLLPSGWKGMSSKNMPWTTGSSGHHARRCLLYLHRTVVELLP